MPGPLHGFRILDLSAVISGPYGTMILADQGADVIKVEPPGRGDFTRSAGNKSGGMSASFLNNNRNKRSIAIDLRHPDGTPLLVHVDVHASSDKHVHLDIRFLLIGPDAAPAPPPGESQEVQWFSWQEAATVADLSLAGGLRSARRLSANASFPGCGRMSEETDG